jgi:hypothetical protein
LSVQRRAAVAAKGQPKMSTKIVVAEPLRRALASIRDSCSYMGVSRSKFYSDILPKLETVHLGARHLVVVSSMDRLIATLTNKPTVHRPFPETERGGCEGTALFGIEIKRNRGLRQAVPRPERARRRSGARSGSVPQTGDARAPEAST